MLYENSRSSKEGRPLLASLDHFAARGRQSHAKLVDGRVAHVLDDALVPRHHQDIQYNELMALAFKAFFNSSSHSKIISIPRQVEMAEFAGNVRSEERRVG